MSIINNLLGYVLRMIFEFVNSYGLSIILFTIFVKVLLLPLTIKQTKSTKAMQDIQPKIQDIQEKYKNKPEKQQQEIMNLYKEAKVNPVAGCLPLLIQMPILIGLFAVLRQPWNFGIFPSQAAFFQADTGFLWLQNLTETGGLSMAILSGASAYIMQKVMMPSDQQQGSMKTMTYVMAAMSFYWGFTFPAGVTLYWTVSNLFSIAQYYLVMSPLKARLAISKEEVIDEQKPTIKK
ncbi:YidC/Oxa1 family membrane protein insertase [Romboutsia sp.]|uniref:YidC/Oxa1 family membrane protein insertase n=1 Tax=Romboutsia sp. TaxID=1965302 RepID=UPI002BFA5126|nr:YidC/Oxa1 family membrane protein insertase [Romboutsia sp.]HSQ90121.1 YidC/Oxa1 family membrane protein insertase [Romboutsia sp.]